METRWLRRSLAVAALSALAGLPGCADLTLGQGSAVTGLTIQDATGTTLVTIEGSAVSGQLVLARDASLPLVISLRGPAGAVSPGLAETIRVTVTNPGVAGWQDAGGGTGTLRGVTAGATVLRVDLLRAGAVVYGAPSVSVTVT
jgi:hypothetical protein